MKREHAPRLAYISASDWDGAVAKGVASMLHDNEEAGYFEYVVTVFPFAPRSLDFALAEKHRLIQYGYDAFPGAKQHRWIRLLLAPVIIMRLAQLLRKLVRAQRIDIVRATDAYWCGILGWFATFGTNTAFCVSIHADWDHLHKLDPRRSAPKWMGSRALAKLVERFVLRRAQLVLCIRKSLIEYAVASGAARGKTRLIPHGVDLALFAGPVEDLRRKFHIPEAARLIVFAGRLSRENYVYQMLDLARALSDVRDAKLVLVGGGIEEQSIRAAVAADADLANKVVLTGFIARETAIALRRAATVNVVPMGGFSLIEACASGRPVVAYDVEWHSELIQNGHNGILVREGDVESFADAVRRLCGDPDLADRLGAAGRASAFELHDIAKVRLRRTACYNELLTRSGAPA